jgi:hypothetical protein
MPSSRRHSWITSRRLAGVTAKPGEAAAARWANSSTASPRPPRPAPLWLASRPGTGSGGTGQQCSPGTFIGWRLVARIVTWGA